MSLRLISLRRLLNKNIAAVVTDFSNAVVFFICFVIVNVFEYDSFEINDYFVK